MKIVVKEPTVMALNEDQLRDLFANVIAGTVDAALDRQRNEFQQLLANNQNNQQLVANAQNQNNPAVNVQGIDELRQMMLRGNGVLFRPPRVFSGNIGKNFNEFTENLKNYMLVQGVRNQNDDIRIALLEHNLAGAALAQLKDIRKGATIRHKLTMVVNKLSL